MSGKPGVIIAAALVFLLLAGCNLPFAAPNLPGDSDSSRVDETRVAGMVAQTLAAAVTDTPGFTPTASATPSPSLTFTPSRVTVSVSVETNCRTGPGKAYPSVGVLFPGETTEVLGRDSAGDYWVVRNPDGSPPICWLWTYYASVTGSGLSLPIATAPPTPTPAPSFSFSYDFWGQGPGYMCFKFEVINTGSVTWESYQITLHNSAHATTATESSSEFIDYDNWCLNLGSQSDLTPGETGMASVKAALGYNPAGETFDVTLKLCSASGLAGTCVSKAITFTP